MCSKPKRTKKELRQPKTERGRDREHALEKEKENREERINGGEKEYHLEREGRDGVEEKSIQLFVNGSERRRRRRRTILITVNFV